MRSVAHESGAELTVVRFAPEGTTDASAGVYATFDEFLAAGVAPDAVVVDTHESAQADALLRRLRAEPFHAHLPAFLTHELEPSVVALADGQADDTAIMHAAVADMVELANTLPDEEQAPDRDTRLLRFLYVRPHFELVPLKNWRQPAIYAFPILDALGGDAGDTAAWIASLKMRNLLESVALVDRLRGCPRCGGVHVGFVDVCPECHAIAIEQKPFLHCYACGGVAPQADYVSGDTLACPKCSIRLRHIGVDYDRTLESFLCGRCAHTFLEPEILASCHQCNTSSATEDLVAHPIETLRLTDTGRLAARSGSVGDVFAALDNLNYASQPYFEHTLTWMLDLCRRHQEVHFGLMCLRLPNVRELIDRIGRNRVVLMMDGLTERLRELIRTTDLATRTSEDHFFLLLPYTPAEGCTVLLDRIREIQVATCLDDGTELVIDGSFFVAPGDVLDQESAAFLMTRLAGETT